MARLTEADKTAMKAVAAMPPFRQPPPRPASPAEVVKFLTEAARFSRGRKPVNFAGAHWQL